MESKFQKVWRVTHQPFSLSNTRAPPSQFPLSFLGCTRSFISHSSFSIHFSLFLSLSSSLIPTQQHLTSQLLIPSLSHRNHISHSKEEIKRLALRFQLQSLWVSKQKPHLIMGILMLEWFALVSLLCSLIWLLEIEICDLWN